MPLGKVDGGRWQWMGMVSAYTLAGGASSAAVGAFAGLVGRSAIPVTEAWAIAAVITIASVLAALQELRLLPFRLPQPHRQTRDRWWKLYPASFAAALWGFDIGLVFSTWFTFAGVWAVLAAAVAFKSVVVGMGVMLAYWAGRSLSVWLGPMLFEDANATPLVLERVAAKADMFRLIHLVALVYLVAVVTVGVTQATLI